MDGWMDGWIDGWMDGWVDSAHCIVAVAELSGTLIANMFSLTYYDVYEIVVFIYENCDWINLTYVFFLARNKFIISCIIKL